MAASIAPAKTLYVRNLNDKIKKGALKQSLLHAFSPFGKVLKITVTKTKNLRGQAWIDFEDVAASTTALREMQGQMLFEMPVRVDFAKQVTGAKAAAADGVSLGKRKRAEDAAGGDEDDTAAPPAKRATTVPDSAEGAADAPAAAGGSGATEPHNILLASNIPAEITDLMLRALFGQYPGMRDIRLIAERGLAFVEFGDVSESLVAMQGLHGFRLTGTSTMQVAFARK